MGVKLSIRLFLIANFYQHQLYVNDIFLKIQLIHILQLDKIILKRADFLGYID